MKKSTTVAVAAVAASVALLSATVFAQGRRPTPDQQAVMFRQGLMTVIGGVEVPLGLMVRGRIPYDAARVSKAAGELTVLTSMIPDAFERDTRHAADVKTGALPVVWQQHSDFLMTAGQLHRQAEALEAAVKGGNESNIKMAIKTLGDTCGQCHMKFRQN